MYLVSYCSEFLHFSDKPSNLWILFRVHGDVISEPGHVTGEQEKELQNKHTICIEECFSVHHIQGLCM